MKTVSIRWLHIVSRPAWNTVLGMCRTIEENGRKKGISAVFLSLLVLKNIGIPLTFKVKYGS